jgi:hypothetical protein
MSFMAQLDHKSIISFQELSIEDAGNFRCRN